MYEIMSRLSSLITQARDSLQIYAKLQNTCLLSQIFFTSQLPPLQWKLTVIFAREWLFKLILFRIIYK